MNSTLYEEELAAAVERMAQEIMYQVDQDILEHLMAETLSEQIKIEQERVKQESTVGKKLVDLF